MDVTVVLLDGESFEEKDVKNDTLGKGVFKSACNKIGLTDETDYFGLRFINKKDGEFQWVDNERNIKPQLEKDSNGNMTKYLHFAVKFFPVNPTNIKHDLTRYQFVLQLRESLLNGRLECSMPIYALLGSFIVQAEFGDYHPDEHSEPYLDDFKFCPEQPPELIEKVHDYHKKHKGMSPEQAELNFLDNVRKLPMYGVQCHLALDVNSEKVFIGVSSIGVTVYRGSRLMSTFIWPKILSVGFKSKKFYIKIKPIDDDDDYCKTSVGFKLADRVAAKRLWKTCVEHHTFFRLENVDIAEKKGLLSRFGSPFRYRGKTENEIAREQPGPEPTFSRVSSKRFSERVLNSNREEPEDAKPETKTEDPIQTAEKEKTTEATSESLPLIEVEDVIGASKQDVVETTPEVKNKDDIPEIKVVQASPELKVKAIEASNVETEQDGEDEGGNGEESEKVNDDKKEDEEKDGGKDGEKDGEDVKEPNTDEETASIPVEETQLVISNPLAEDGVKSFSSHSVTTTTYTTQSSTDDGDDAETFDTSSTVISSMQVTTVKSETKQEVITTNSTTTKTLLEQVNDENAST